MAKEVNLLDVFIKLVKHRWFIFKTVFFITLLALLISLVWPKMYKSTVRFFPPPRGSAGLSGLLSNFFQPTVSASKLNPEAIMIILQSRKLRESVINKFRLDEVYNQDILEFLLEKLDSNIEIIEVREGGFGFNPMISAELSFYDEDPNRAKQVTAYIVAKLDTIVKELHKERTNHNLKIVKKRYLQNLNDMKIVEQEFKDFQEKYGVFEIESQTKAVIENIAELKAQITQTEIQLDVLGQSVSSENVQIRQLKLQRLALKRKMNDGIQITETSVQEKVFHPLNAIPALFARYAQLYREVTVQNKVYEFIYPQYEQVRLEATTQSQGIQILDPAHFPTYKAKPKRLYIVLAGFVFSVFLSLLIVFIKELVLSQKELNSPTYQKLVFIKETLKNDLKFKKKS